MNNTNILITGATGFIGKHLSNALIRKGHRIYPFSRPLGCDIRRKESFVGFINKEIKTVYHLAGETSVQESWERPEDFYETNSEATQNVLDFCVKIGARLIYISGYVYGIPSYLPIDEEHPVRPSNPYAYSKWLGEKICSSYAKDKGLKIIVLRPFNIYGEGQSERFLIPRIIKQIMDKGAIEIKDESPRRDYLYISDFIEVCTLLMDYSGDLNLFNVGFGVSHSVKDIVEEIVQGYGKEIPWISLGEKRVNEIPETIASYKRLGNALGWQPKVTFAEGIRRILDSYKNTEPLIG